ncbi:MAG: DNA-protecting protein DprA, partial [Alphaproteobacteria bacterium]|nr:DNA-protecting protein DprA [Alphaproteobacteria bacterium]
SISIVGARNASINGRKTASRIAYDLTNSGVVVVSGMARGIDTAAHKGAMYACNQQGPTIAVLGTGIDVPYPDENTELYKQIAKQGCVISEFAPGTLPQTGNFPRRNKIVAALSIGTLIMEATQNSGSLITAKLAAEYGKHLFAVPGAPDEARSIGPNSLIKSGAVLTESAKDILETIHIDKSPNIKIFSTPKQSELLLEVETQNTPKEDNMQRKIIDYLNFDGVYVDEIIRASGLSEAEVALELLELEMVGKIERQSGNKVALIKHK